MLDLPDETIVLILSALSYIEIETTVVRVCQNWHELRSSAQFRASRAAADERGLVVTGGDDARSNLCRALIGDRWFTRASLPCTFFGSSTLFRGELVVLGREWDQSGGILPCCRAFDLETNAWRKLEWEGDSSCLACCATDAVIVALSLMEQDESRQMLKSLRPGSAQGWVPIPGPPVDVFYQYECLPSLCCVEDVLFVIGGRELSGVSSDACQTFDLSTRSWTVRASLPEARHSSACVELAGRLYIVGGVQNETGEEFFGGVLSDDLCSKVFSYDPRTDRWRSESPLPLVDYDCARYYAAGLRAVAHEGRVVVVGIEGAPPLALAVDGEWTELPPLPQDPSDGCAGYASMASLRIG